MLTVIEILEIIGGFVGIFAIIIVIWDHFKDDRLLTREVQEFYEAFENFLASYLKERQSGERQSIYISEMEYYKSIIKSKFPEYSKYLGLTYGKSHDSRYQNNEAYLTKTGHILVNSGEILLRNPKTSTLFEMHIIGNPALLKRSEIPAIEAFFADLREHWKINYHKALFRPKLRKKIDFTKFIIDDN